MVVSLQKTEKDASEKKAARHYSDYVGDGDSEFERFKLVSLLQSTLDLKTLLKYFLENIRESLTIDGVYYHEEERGIKIRLGKQSSHSCGYRLSNAGVESGELTFKRDTRFSETELQKIENNILLLLAPISNAIKYSDAVASANQNSVRRIISRGNLHASLRREIELAKRHNHPLAIVSICFHSGQNLNDVAVNAEIMDAFADLMLKNKDSTNLIYRAAKLEFLLITPNDPELVSHTIESVKGWYNLLQDQFEMPPLQLNIGYATVTGTDSVKSVIDRAKKNVAADSYFSGRTS
jgi:GGDEF domain-containing protein